MRNLGRINHIIFLLLLSSWLIAGQRLQTSNDDDGVTKTVIDILSNNVQFSTFLRSLQRNQLIPFLNELTNITLVAPVNSAFAINNNGTHVEKFTLDDLKKYVITEAVSSDDFVGTRIFNTYYDDNSPILVSSDASNEKFEINGVDVVETDFYAESQGSVVQGIENLFKDSIPAKHLVGEIDNTLIFQQLIHNKDLSNKTLLIPIDDAFNLKDYEVNYLKSEFGLEDSKFLYNSLSIDGILGGDLNVSVQDNNGFHISFSSQDLGDHIVINDTISSSKSNILARDSILHLFKDQDLIPKIELNPLKVIAGLNASALVNELMLQKLDYLITNNSIEQTIFIPNQESNQFYIVSKNSNLYHFVDEKIENLSEKSQTLYNTKFCSSKKLGSSCQRVKIEERKPGKFTLNGNYIVTDGPFEIGETVIYITDEDLRTPSELTSSINPVYHCSKSLKYMDSLGLLKLSNNNLGYTYFLPCYDAWEDFELTANYFQKNSTALDILMKHFILNGLFYSDFQKFDEIKYKNLNDEDVTLKNIGAGDGENETQTLNLKYNNVNFNLKKNDDILYTQGVVHPINKLILPKGLNINLKEIIKSSDVALFIDIVDMIPDVNVTEIFESQNYSILLPPLKSLEKNYPFESNITLEKFIKLHIIKQSSLKNLYSCSGDIETLLGVNLTCSRISGKGDFFLQIDEESDNGVRVLSKGCTNSENYNCVFAIDRPISIKWLDDHEHYHLNLPGVALAVGILLGVVVMIFIFVCLMLFVARRKNSFICHIEENARPDENSPLLAGTESSGDEHLRQNSKNAKSDFGQNYSSNTVVNPIRMSNPANREPNMT